MKKLLFLLIPLIALVALPASASIQDDHDYMTSTLASSLATAPAPSQAQEVLAAGSTSYTLAKTAKAGKKKAKKKPAELGAKKKT